MRVIIIYKASLLLTILTDKKRLKRKTRLWGVLSPQPSSFYVIPFATSAKRSDDVAI